MSANFKSDDWILIKEILEKSLDNQRAILENPDKSYKDKLVATGQVLLIKKLLILPQGNPKVTLPLKGYNAN